MIKNNKIKKVLYGFMLVQCVCVVNNYYQLNNNIKSSIKSREESNKLFYNLEKTIIEGNQNEAINHFNQLMNKDSISDLSLNSLIAKAIIKGKSEMAQKLDAEAEKKYPEEEQKNIAKLKEESRFKWTEETKSFIIKNYLKNPKGGLQKEYEKFNNFSCLFIDLSCKVMKNYFVGEFNASLKTIENKIDINLYNIQHKDEYFAWENKWMTDLKNGVIITEQNMITPGHIAVLKK